MGALDLVSRASSTFPATPCAKIAAGKEGLVRAATLELPEFYISASGYSAVRTIIVDAGTLHIANGK